MALQQRVLFTALPVGADADVNGRYHLSVHVSPRLSNTLNVATALDQFPDWDDWPATIGALSWSVDFGGGDLTVPATVVSAAPSSARWTELFASNTVVRSHVQKKLDNNKKISYPNKNVEEFLRDRYTKIGLGSPDEFPHIDDLLAFDMFGPVDPALLAGSTAKGAVELELNDPNKRAVTNGAPLTNIPKDFHQLDRFHRPRNDGLGGPVPAPTLDFHAAVATVGQHPALMRLLGLVVDLVVDVPLSDLPPSPTIVAAAPAWTPATAGPGGSAVALAVRTRVVIGAGLFAATPRAMNPELVDKRLPFDDTARFSVVVPDIDGGGLKAIDFAGNLKRLKNGPNGLSIASPDRYALPSLRSAGLSVARVNRAPEFHKRMGRAAQTGDSVDAADPEPVVVDAEDITRGYRIDVRDVADERWFSLSARTGTYEFLPTGDGIPYSDESWVSAAPTAKAPALDADLYLQETLFRWGGWSLAAPRPGARLATTQADDPPVTTDADAPPPEFPMRIDRAVTPGTLPRLRFGRSYQVRARAVDLAGNSDPLNPSVEDRHASPPVRYARFEPVPTPPVLPHAPRTAGESLERVVLRSNYNADPEPGVVVARHIVPPKGEQLLAEQHGMFDTVAPGSIVDPSTYITISKYVAPTPPPGPVLQSEQGDWLRSSEGVQDPEDYDKTRYFPLDLVTLPYLPDPIARGAAFKFLNHPAQAGHLFKAPFAPEPGWPVYRPLRLVLEQPANELISQLPTYDPGTHQVLLRIGKGQELVVRLSAYLDPDDLDELGIWNWILAGGGGGLREQVTDGQHWMTTPYRELRLVHAVRQPLSLATFTTFSANKALGATAATFAGFISYSRRSTSKVDIHAAWNEFIDRGAGTGLPTPASPPPPRRALAFSVPGNRGSAGPLTIGPDRPEDRQEFGDTKHRNVTYTTVATSRFTEYFVEDEKFSVDYGGGDALVTELPTGGQGVVPGSVRVKNQVVKQANGTITGAGAYVEGKHFTVSDAGVLTIKKGPVAGGFVPQGQAVVVEFLANPVSRPSPGEQVPPRTLNILNSAAPAPPKVLYVVPTFRFSSAVFSGYRVSTRSRGGLRVYLERPWWTSGDGELLGVVLQGANVDLMPDSAQASVTRWGMDPVFESTPTTFARPALASFPSKTRTGSALTAPGVPVPVDVAGHPVGFDADRDLWYCDINVSTISYMPFIRLALARFQPDSVVGAHLSSVVVADFSQLTPDRTATVQGSGNKRTVTVVGQSYDRVGDAASPLASVRAHVEEFDSAIGGELGWRQIGNPVELDPQTKVFISHRWRGEVTIPQGTAGRPKRIVVEERERHRSGATPVFASRVVYVDAINLSGGGFSNG